MSEIRLVIWSIFLCGFLFGLVDRSSAALSDGVVDAVDLVQFFTASFFAVCAGFLKPLKGE